MQDIPDEGDGHLDDVQDLLVICHLHGLDGLGAVGLFQQEVQVVQHDLHHLRVSEGVLDVRMVLFDLTVNNKEFCRVFQGIQRTTEWNELTLVSTKDMKVNTGQTSVKIYVNFKMNCALENKMTACT